MSEISESFKKYSRDDQGHGDVLGKIIRRGDFYESDNEYPGLSNQVKNCQKLTDFMISAGVRYFQGRSPWKNWEEAVMETGEFLKDKMATYLLSCLARGIVVGKHRHELQAMSAEEAIDRIFEQDFVDECVAVHENELHEDEDLADLISEMVVESLGKFLENSGIKQMTGRQLAHVWNGWKFVLNGSGSAFYVYGVEMGTDKHVDHQFNELAALIGSLDG